MIRYQYIIYKPNPDIDGDPYIPVKTVYSRDEAMKLCPLGSEKYASVAKQVSGRGRDDYGTYQYWDTVASGSLENDELHSEQDIEDFLERW